MGSSLVSILALTWIFDPVMAPFWSQPGLLAIAVAGTLFMGFFVTGTFILILEPVRNGLRAVGEA